MDLTTCWQRSRTWQLSGSVTAKADPRRKGQPDIQCPCSHRGQKAPRKIGALQTRGERGTHMYLTCPTKCPTWQTYNKYTCCHPLPLAKAAKRQICSNSLSIYLSSVPWDGRRAIYVSGGCLKAPLCSRQIHKPYRVVTETGGHIPR